MFLSPSAASFISRTSSPSFFCILILRVVVKDHIIAELSQYLQPRAAAIVIMRFSTLAGAFAGAALVTASPILEHRQERSVEGDMVVVRDITVVQENCEVVRPKVFIISMVPASLRSPIPLPHFT